jgi:hypothetical protein
VNLDSVSWVVAPEAAVRMAKVGPRLPSGATVAAPAAFRVAVAAVAAKNARLSMVSFVEFVHLDISGRMSRFSRTSPFDGTIPALGRCMVTPSPQGSRPKRSRRLFSIDPPAVITDRRDPIKQTATCGQANKPRPGGQWGRCRSP